MIGNGEQKGAVHATRVRDEHLLHLDERIPEPLELGGDVVHGSVGGMKSF